MTYRGPFQPLPCWDSASVICMPQFLEGTFTFHFLGSRHWISRQIDLIYFLSFKIFNIHQFVTLILILPLHRNFCYKWAKTEIHKLYRLWVSKIIQSLRLEKTSKIIKSNHQPNTTVPTKPCPELPHLYIFRTPPRMATPSLPWAGLFQCLTTLSVKKFFLISNLKLPWHNLRLFPIVLSIVSHFFPPHSTTCTEYCGLFQHKGNVSCLRWENRVQKPRAAVNVNAEPSPWLLRRVGQTLSESMSQTVRKNWNSEIKLLLQRSSASEAMRSHWCFLLGFSSPSE